MVDLRTRFFDGLDWYAGLESPESDESTAWYLVKGPEADDMWVSLLNATLAFAVAHDLVGPYRKRFAGLHLADFSLERAEKDRRTQSFPIWEIANELLVGRYLERVFGWRLAAHEPPGNGTSKGEWEFRTLHDRRVFVEVKSLRQPIIKPTEGAYSQSIDAPRITAVLKDAYRQLPRDHRSTLVVLVGNRVLWTPQSAPLVGAVPAALFGHFGIRFNVMPYDPESVREGPSLHDMFLQQKKNRRLGCVAALRPGGLERPTLGFYAIHNPYAHHTARVDPRDFAGAWQFVFESNRGIFVGADDPEDAWEKMRDGP